MPSLSRTLFETVKFQAPNVVRLAVPLSIASRVEPALVRQVRLALFPDLETGVEIELWHSPLVEARSPMAIVLRPDVAHFLHKQIVDKNDLLKASDLIRSFHKNLPEPVRIEEQITFMLLTGERKKISDVAGLLRKAITSLVANENLDFAHWCARLLSRAPERLHEIPEAWVLNLAVSSLLGGRRLAMLPDPPPALSFEELSWALSNPETTRKLFIANEPNDLVISCVDPEQSDLRIKTIEVPVVDPIVLEIGERHTGKNSLFCLDPKKNETIRFPRKSNKIYIRTSSNKIYDISLPVQEKSTESDDDVDVVGEMAAEVRKRRNSVREDFETREAHRNLAEASSEPSLLHLVQTDERPLVFVSYSHSDETWKDTLMPHLKSLERLGELSVWDDRQILAGTEWYARIRHVLMRTKVAICLISPEFLASSFCMHEEIPYLLQARNRGDLEIFPILIRDCVWEAHSWLKRLQMLPRGAIPLTRQDADDQAAVFAELARQVRDMLRSGGGWERPPPAGAPPEKVDIARLPDTGDLLFGRQDELNALDKIWSQNTLNVAVFKASGGVGKSSLVRAWIEDMALDNYRGAERVFAWSFYSQGADRRATSADEFISHALGWFDDATRGEGLSPWDRGQRLAELVREKRTLLLLDGLEPLQSGQAFDRGKIKDPGLEVLLDELGRSNPGLCLISTREEIGDIWHDLDQGQVGQYDLDTISTTAGRALLRVSGIEGEDDALERAVQGFGQHAYAVKLLGNFLVDCGLPDIKHAVDIPDLPDVEEKDGKHSRRMMAAFAERFGDSAKADILAMLGLFDRPADAGCIAALRKKPAIPGLNAAVLPISEAVWQEQIAELRKLGLLTPESHHAPDELDAHPLVREHFGTGLREEREEAWKAGHERLYEYLKTVPEKHQPDTLAEMAPLLQAIHHGCQVERRQDAYGEIYQARIRRDDEAFLVKKLGAFGADLSLLAFFFDSPFEHPAADLTEGNRAWLLNAVAFRLCALGRVVEAMSPMRACLEMCVKSANWKEAAVGASNLSQLQLAIGDLAAADASSKAAIEYADQSGDAFQRMINRTAHASVKHQSGAIATAQALFEEAEAVQAESQPAYPRLYARQGHLYCDLLLARGQAEAVRERAAYALKIAIGGNLPILTVALDHLSFGRAALALGDRNEARARFDQAIEGLRQSGHADELPHGLLARAAFFREEEEYEKSRRDLDEVMRFAKRSGMRLDNCDAHFDYARLEIKQGQHDKARLHLEKAAKLVEDCGYHRRDGDVAALKEELGL